MFSAINKVWGGYTAEMQYAPWRATLITITPNPQVAEEAFRPPGWASLHPQTFIEDPDGNLWYFDATLRLDHLEYQRITRHPVQTGANITDHSYAEPARLTLEIGMSDVMQSYIPSQWGSDTSEPTKSVAAYQQIIAWKKYGTPLKITTRLMEYYPMVVASTTTSDTAETQYGLRSQITFQQIFTAVIAVQPNSARPQTTESTNSGTKSSQSPPLGVVRGPEGYAYA